MLQEKAIVCPKNEMIDVINEKVLDIVQAEGRSYTSHDQATPKMNDGGATEKMSLTVDADPHPKTTATAVVPQRNLAYFTELNPADNSKFIQVRVYHKWTAMKVPSRIPTGFSCILLDKKGSVIQANADLKEKDRFERDLQINCVFKIQGFGFDKTDTWGKTLDNDFTLCFGKYTQIDLLQDNDYPYHYFNFAAFNELSARLERKNPILTDYIGYVHNVEKVKEYGGATTNKVKVRNIGIRNLKYSQTNTVAPQLEVQTERLTDWEQERNRNRVPLGTLLQIDPNTQQRVLFTQDVMILRIDTAHEWYYQKCDECGGKLRYGYVHGQCHQYGNKPNPENRRHGKCHDDLLHAPDRWPYQRRQQLASRSRRQRSSKHSSSNTGSAEYTPCFPIPVRQTNNERATTFVLQKIMDNPPVAIPETAAGPSSPPTPPAEHHTDEHLTPPPATPTATQDTPTDTQTDVPTVSHKTADSSATKELFTTSTEEETNPIPKKQGYIFCIADSTV
ncbi:hypothetical protein CTI12_AA287650 [Artemisia annua]|uniref:Replication protein A 70 kDa DNA-binding subunit B/D first OB fold domain-containing protein n=1 Tax=Artemisia annua TaxID=35608 RepID=A0A2U1NAP0_ARTAN|nr:hypothetical protein CTI12_AA287650 [Artemisia annua]